jgi:hypothetical protein
VKRGTFRYVFLPHMSYNILLQVTFVLIVPSFHYICKAAFNITESISRIILELYSLHEFNKAKYSSPSNNPGTSPSANKVFIHSIKLLSITFDLSSKETIFSPLQPERHNK